MRAAARATAVASHYDKETVALTVISSVATTYFQALEFRDRLQVARDNLANGEKILHGLRLEQTAGIATGLDVAQQETTVALLFAAIPPLQQQFRQSVNALAVLIGKTPESIDIDSGTLNTLTSPASRRGPAFAAAGAPPGCGRIGTATDLRECRYHRGARGLVSEHPVDRGRRLRKLGAGLAHQSGQSRLGPVRGSYAADISRRRIARPRRFQQCTLSPNY